MSDIKKGYTFTDKSTDWVSNKETAIRLNKMLDDAKLNLVAGTNISITPTPNGPSIAASGGGTGTVTAVTGTLPILSSGGTAPDISINAATTLLPGSMSAADKSKLDGIAAGAQVNVATNLAQGTRTTTAVPVTSSTGTTATLDVATTSLAGVMSSADKSKLDAATNANTASTIVARDASGNFTATTITAALTGNASTVTTNANLTGAVTSVGNATTVVTNANLTGDVTSTGNATAITAGVIVNADVNSGAAISYSKLAALTSANIIVGSNLNVATSTAVTGDVTISNTGATTIGADKVTNSQLANMGATTVKVNATASAADPTDLLVGANTVVGRVAGDIVAAQVVTGQIADNAVTNAKAAQMATQTIKGRTTAGTGNTEDLNATQATAILNTAAGDLGSGGTKGLVPAPVIGDATKFLRGDMTYQTVVADSITDTVTTIAPSQNAVFDALALKKTDSMTTNKLLGRGTANTGVIEEITIGSNLSLTGTTLNATGGGGGSGTVTSVSVVTANGVSGTVTDPTTTPAITLTLGDISAATSKPTSSSIPATFIVSGNIFSILTVGSTDFTTIGAASNTVGVVFVATGVGTGTGTVTNRIPRTFAVRAADVFNVKDFGAAGNGSTNDLPAFNAAATAMLSAGGGCIVIPAGSYNLSGAWTITKTTNGQSVCIRGYGCGVTKLHFNTASNGIEIIGTVNQTEGATTSNVDTVEDLSICASQSGGYKALKIINKNNNSSSIGCLVRRISIEGYSRPASFQQYWDTGIHLVDCGNAAISDVRSNSAANQGDGILLESNTAQTICNINRVNIQGHDFGLRVIGNNSYEGVTVYACTFVAVNTAVFWDTISGEEQLNVTDCHINPKVSYIVVNNCERVWVTNLNGLIDQRGGAAPTIAAGSFVVGRRYKIKTVGTTDFTAIGASANTVGVSFVATGAGAGSGDAYQTASIDIRGSCRQSKVVHCCIDGSAEEYAIICQSPLTSFVDNVMKGHNTGIFLDSGSNLGLVTGNQLYNSAGTARAGTCVQDNGANNQVFNNF